MRRFHLGHPRHASSVSSAKCSFRCLGHPAATFGAGLLAILDSLRCLPYACATADHLCQLAGFGATVDNKVFVISASSMPTTKGSVVNLDDRLAARSVALTSQSLAKEAMTVIAKRQVYPMRAGRL